MDNGFYPYADRVFIQFPVWWNNECVNFDKRTGAYLFHEWIIHNRFVIRSKVNFGSEMICIEDFYQHFQFWCFHLSPYFSICCGRVYLLFSISYLKFLYKLRWIWQNVYLLVNVFSTLSSHLFSANAVADASMITSHASLLYLVSN